MSKEKIRVQVDGGKVTWSRGGGGLSISQFVDQYPCEALEVLTSGKSGKDAGAFAEAILSTIGGSGDPLIQFNKEHNCGCEENQLQQI